MAFYFDSPSRTFNEYLLVPNLTTKDCTPDKVSLKTPLVKFKVGDTPELMANIPLVSAIMQSVSGEKMGIALAREGGVSFTFVSQPIEAQAQMIKGVKSFKAGFCKSNWNLKPDNTLSDILKIKRENDHTTIPVTDDGSHNGKLLGLITSKDYRVSRNNLDTKVSDIMTPIDTLIYANEGISLPEANDIIWKNKINCLPIVDKNGNLSSLVFRKDYEIHKDNPLSLYDKYKRYVVGAGINTRDYEDRIPALVEAGVDILCLDSSDGYSEWQKDVIQFVRKNYGNSVKIGAGNVVDKDAFYYLADAGADFIKIGIGGGSICITREQKGIGRGQASAVIDVVSARNEYLNRTGYYIPLCSDGGIVHDYHITLALAMGCDFVMMGRYFARFDESPTRKLTINNSFVKEYWGEGSARARNWQRYDLGEDTEGISFVEGVDSYVPYAGSLKENLGITLKKIKSTMSNCGSNTLEQFHDNAKLTLVSSTSIIEGGAHDVTLKDQA